MERVFDCFWHEIKYLYGSVSESALAEYFVQYALSIWYWLCGKHI